MGMACLAAYPPGVTVSLAEIAQSQQLPSTFLAKIFQKLSRHGLLEAERGRGSGYALSRDAGSIRIRDIVEAVEGPLALEQCLLWGGHCNDKEPCPLHGRLQSLRHQLDAILDEITLADYVNESPKRRFSA